MSQSQKVIFELAGQQHIASVGDKLAINRIPEAVEGESIQSNRVLAIIDANRTVYTAADLAKAFVSLEITKKFLGDKKICFKKRRRTNSIRKRGMRAKLLIVCVKSINI